VVKREPPGAVEQWCHSHEFDLDSAQQERATTKVLVLTVVTMVAELAAGLAFGSMALFADGWHMATHAAAFGVTLFAYRYARAHARDPAYSFGTGKVSVLGGFASAVALAFVALLMIGESLHRLIVPVPIRFDAALAVAALGLVVNLVSARLLNAHQHEHGAHDHNLRAAYLHVLADALTSILAIVALLCGKYLDQGWLDPVTGVLGSALIARWSWGLIRDSSRILLDGSAGPGTRARVQAAIEADGATVTDLHVWRVGPHKYAVIISLETPVLRSADHYKSLISAVEDLSHVSVEVNLTGGEPSAAARPGGAAPRARGAHRH
jgi:cation diffusion facilitator family transporter